VITDWIDIPPTNATLNGLLVFCLRTLYNPNPIQNVRQILYGKTEESDVYTFNGLTDVHPPYLVISWNGAAMIFIGGTSGQIHIQRLLNGWTNPNDGPGTEFGIMPAFGLAARSIIDAVGPEQFAGVERFYILGHSYGGAVAQALGVMLRPIATRGVKVWSYGAPRTGTARLQTFLGTMTNTRFFADNDPVRFIPPHSDESPILTLLDNWPLVRGCNQQVQSPTGYEIQANGIIVQTEGNPTVLHAVATSVANWVADANGFRSVNHGLENYQQRFEAAEAIVGNFVLPGPGVKREEPLNITSAERERIKAAGVLQMRNDLAQPDPVLNNFAVGPMPAGSTLRYVRRRVGSVWGVKYGTEVVAIGPGKRAARRMAREFNRATVR
jgi:pimeloyl-ACP methyl ester carboxylesterase